MFVQCWRFAADSLCDYFSLVREWSLAKTQGREKCTEHMVLSSSDFLYILLFFHSSAGFA